MVSMVTAAAGPSVGVDQARDHLRRNQRVVARQHGHRPVGRHRLTRGEHRGAGALAVGLLGDRHVPGKAVLHALTRPRDAHDLRRARRAGGVDDPADHRLPAHSVQHLGGLGLHPSPVAGGHDQGSEGLRHEGSASVAAGRPGPMLGPLAGEWCNWQHRRFWSFRIRFESWLPSLRPGRPPRSGSPTTRRRSGSARPPGTAPPPRCPRPRRPRSPPATPTARA